MISVTNNSITYFYIILISLLHKVLSRWRVSGGKCCIGRLRREILTTPGFTKVEEAGMGHGRRDGSFRVKGSRGHPLRGGVKGRNSGEGFAMRWLSVSRQTAS